MKGVIIEVESIVSMIAGMTDIVQKKIPVRADLGDY